MKKRSVLLILLSFLMLASCVPAASVPEAEDEPPSAPPTPSAPEETPVPVTPPPRDEAERLLRAMSTEEKVRQLLLVCCHKPENAEEAAAFGAGGLCLFADYFAGKSRDEVVAALAALQETAPVPLLLAVDEEGGLVCRVSVNKQLRFANFDSPRRLYERGGWPLIEKDAEEKTRLLLDLGLNVNLAPVADVSLNKNDYIYPRCFSTDYALTAEFITRAVGVMKEMGIGCTLKHFPGYGGSADTHTGEAFDERPMEAFTEGDFLPFIAGIEAGADAVLVSHNIVLCMDNGAPASLSPEVHRILREELGFEGVVLCDDLSMDAIRRYFGGGSAAAAAVMAGNDLICCGDWEEAAADILDAVEKGFIPMEQLDASVLRVLRWKTALGLELP